MSAAGRVAMSGPMPRQAPTNRILLFSNNISVFFDRSAEERLANPDSLVIERYNLNSLPIPKTPEPTIIKLSCASNNISHLSDALLNFPNLQYLDISNNKFETLDGIASFCPELRVLKARNCTITHLSDVQHLTKLRYLDLSDNKLAGAILLDSSLLPKGIQFLSLRNNDITSIICTRAMFSELMELNLNGNKIEQIDIDPKLLPRLEKLDLGGNSLHDPVLLTPLLHAPQLRLIVIKHNAFCIPFEPLFTTRISNQQIIQSFSDAFNRLVELANDYSFKNISATDKSFLLLADFGDFRSYFVLRYKDPKRGMPQLSFSDVKIDKANFTLKGLHNLHTRLSFGQYTPEGYVADAGLHKRLPSELLDDTIIYNMDNNRHKSNQNISTSGSSSGTYSYYSTDDEEPLMKNGAAAERASISISKIPRPVSEGTKYRKQSQEFTSKSFIDNAATMLMKKLEVETPKSQQQTTGTAKQDLHTSKSFSYTTKGEGRRSSTASNIRTDVPAAMVPKAHQDFAMGQKSASLFTPDLFRTQKSSTKSTRAESPLSVLMRPSVTGNPLLLGKEVRELKELGTEMYASSGVGDSIETSSGKGKRRTEKEETKGQSLQKSGNISRKDRASPHTAQTKVKSVNKQRPTSANNVSQYRLPQSAHASQHSLNVINQQDMAVVKMFKTRTVDYKVFPKQSKEMEEVNYEFTRLSDFYRLIEGTSGYLVEEISGQPHGGLHSGNSETSTGPVHTLNSGKEIIPMLVLRPRRGCDIKDFSSPTLAQDYEVFIAGVQRMDDVELVGPLSTLLSKMISKDPTLFTMPSISVKEVNLTAAGYESGTTNYTDEGPSQETGLIIVPIKISTDSMHSDINYLTGNFIQSISFFRCNMDLYDFSSNPDLSQFIESIELLSCGIMTLAQIQFVSMFSRLRRLVIYDDITKRSYFRTACLYYCPTLEVINDVPVSEADWSRVNVFIKKYGVFIPLHLRSSSGESETAIEKQAKQMLRQVTASVDGIRRNLCCSTWIQFKKA